MAIKRIVISGPTGAIGMALIKQCIKENIAVLAICHKGSARIGNIPCSPLIKAVEADLADYDRLFYGEKITENYDIFYHFAWNGTVGEARNDMYLQTDNITYTLAAIELAERLGCHTFIGAGSQAEYGRVEGKLTPVISTNPENGYGMAKLCAGQMSRVVCEKKQMKHIWTRILSVYGPYDGTGSMVMTAVRKFWNGEQTAFTPGEQTWDYLYSEDAAQIFLALGEKGIHGNVYCIGSGQARELKSYIKDIYQTVKAYQKGNIGMQEITAEAAENEQPSERKLGIGLVPYGEKQVMSLCADITLLEQHIGSIPHTDFKKGIRAILEENRQYLELGQSCS